MTSYSYFLGREQDMWTDATCLVTPWSTLPCRWKNLIWCWTFWAPSQCTFCYLDTALPLNDSLCALLPQNRQHLILHVVFNFQQHYAKKGQSSNLLNWQQATDLQPEVSTSIKTWHFSQGRHSDDQSDELLFNLGHSNKNISWTALY